MSRLETLVVATTPLTVLVITPALAARVLELIMEVEEETPFTIEVKVFTADERSLELTKLAVVVEMMPLVSEVRVKELVEVEIESVLLVMMLLVAVTPLIVVVSTLPEADWVNELMKLITAEATPFTKDVKLLVVVDITFEFTRSNVVVATTPLVVLVSRIELVEEVLERVLVVLEARRDEAETCSTVPEALTVRSELVAEPDCTEVRVVVPRVAVEVAVRLPEVRLVPVALSNKKLEMYPVSALNIEANRFVLVALVRVALVPVRFVAARLVVVALFMNALVTVASPKIGLSVKM